MCDMCAVYYVCMVSVICTWYVHYMYSVVFGVMCVVWLVLSCPHSLSDEAIFEDLLIGVSSSAIGHCLHVRLTSLFLPSGLSCREFSVTDPSARMTGVAGSGESGGWAGSWEATQIRLVFLGIREERRSNGDWNPPLTGSPSLTPLPFQPGRACVCQHHRMGTGGLRVRQFLPRSLAWTDPPAGRRGEWVRLHLGETRGSFPDPSTAHRATAPSTGAPGVDLSLLLPYLGLRDPGAHT